MCVAFGAVYFDAVHAVGEVGFGGDVVWVGGGPEAGPARAGLEFVVGVEEFGAAADTVEGAVFVAVPELTGEGAFGAALAGDVVLFLGQNSAPFGVGLVHFFYHLGVLSSCAFSVLFEVR